MKVPLIPVATLMCVSLISGCSGSDDSDAIAEAFVQSVVAGTQSGGVSEVFWQPCIEDSPELDMAAKAAGRDLDDIACALIPVPLDWSHPDNGGTIDIAVVKAPATGSNTEGALFVNPGGPGESGLELAIDLALDPSFESVGKNFDVIGFDPRGTGESEPIECDSDGPQSGTVETLKQCLKNNPQAEFIGTRSVAWDMDYIRRNLGYETLSYLGFSYGTVIGATYAHMFGENVDKMVLDSASPASWAGPEQAFDQEIAIVQALGKIGEDCEQSGKKCPYVSTESLQHLIDKVDETPLIATGGEEVTGPDVYNYLTDALYLDPEDITAALDTVNQAVGGSHAAAAKIIDEAGESKVNGTGMIISCLSAPPGDGSQKLKQHMDDVGVPELLGGPDATDEIVEPFIQDYCEVLPKGKDYLPTFAADVRTPILVIGITGDHATPYEGSVALANDLGNAELLTLNGRGHAASYSQKSTCVDDYVTRYLLSGLLPPENTVCPED